MKKLLVLLICSALLTGCGYDSFRKESPIIKEDVEWKTEWKYELTPRNNAYMYNSGIVKLLAYTSTREAFTYMIPQWHTYTQLQPNKDYLFDAYLCIKSTQGSTEIKQPETLNTITYTFRYLTSEQYLANGGNWLLRDLYNTVNTIDSYDTEKYSSYSEYVEDYKASIDNMLLQDVSTYDTVIIKGEETEHSAIGYALSIKINDTVYTLPCVTYYWRLESGNYLSVHISIDNVKYQDLNSTIAYTELDKKELIGQLQACAEANISVLPYAEKIADYVLIGDFSSLFPKTSDESSIWERLDEDVKKEYEEDIKVDFVEEEMENEVIEEGEQRPNRTDAGSDYDREVQGYFDE